MAGGIWIVIMEGESLSSRTYTHVAFKVMAAELERATTAVQRLGLDKSSATPKARPRAAANYCEEDAGVPRCR